MFMRHHQENHDKEQAEKLVLFEQLTKLKGEFETEKQRNINVAANMEDVMQKMQILETKLSNTVQRVAINEKKSASGGVGNSNVGSGGSDIRKEAVLQKIQSNLESINQINGTVATISQNLSDVDLRHQLHENTTYTGHMIWKIDNFEKRFEQAVIGKTTALHSAPSFTDKYGYKFCARLYLNGDGMGKGTHVSLFFVLMKSEFDSLLPWPFSKTVTFTLLNQDNSEKNVKESFNADVKSSSFKRPTKHMNIASGCPFFVAQEKLKEPGNGFIKDGCFYLDIKVK